MEGDSTAQIAALSAARRHCRAAMAAGGGGGGGAARVLAAAVEAQGAAKNRDDRIRGHLSSILDAAACGTPHATGVTPHEWYALMFKSQRDGGSPPLSDLAIVLLKDRTRLLERCPSTSYRAGSVCSRV